MADGSAPATSELKGRSLRQRLDERLVAMKSERTSWESHYSDLSDYILPRAYRAHQSGQRNKGEKKQQRILNGTGTYALKIVTAGMVSGLTSPAMPWLRMKAEDEALNELGAVRWWTSEVQKTINRVLAKSNFYQAMPVIDEALVLMGTGVLVCDEDRETVVRFTPLTTGEYWVSNDHTGKVGSLYREFEWTVERVVREFGEDRVCEQTRDMWRRGQYDRPILIRHAIEQSGPIVGKNRFQWVSFYWEANGKQDDILRQKGYRTRPFFGARWAVTGSDAYGRSPCMEALGDVKQLQFSEKVLALALDRAADGPKTGPALNGGTLDLMPGAYNPVGAGGGQIYEVFPNAHLAVNSIREEIQVLEQRVVRHIGADMFLVAIGSDKDMTATEVMARSEEKLMQLGPVVTHITEDILRPLLDRVFDVLIQASIPRWQRGEPAPLPIPPEELQGGELEIEFVSPLQAAQRSYAGTAIQRLLTFVGGAAQLSPQITDKIDWDQSVDEYADTLGTDPKIVAGDDTVAEVRAAREQAAQQQHAAQQLQGMAGMAEQLGKAKVTPDTALGALAGAAQGAQ